MKLDDLKKMSTRDLTALYNKHAEKQVARMSSRAKLEERTRQLLEDSGDLTAGPSKEVISTSPATGETDNSVTQGDTTMAKAAAKSTTKSTKSTKSATAKSKQPTAAEKAKAAKAVAAAAAAGDAAADKPAPKAKAKADAPAGRRGAPMTDYTYTAKDEKAKDYNPRGYKMQETSMRNKIFQAIKAAPNGIKRSKLEAKFAEDGGNVKGQLDVLVKLQMVTTAE